MILRETRESVTIDVNYSKTPKSGKQQLDAKSKGKYDQSYLNQFTCVCFLLMLQIPLDCLISYAHLYTKFGTVLVSIAYILLVLFIGMPLYMIIILMGQYCRKGFIKFWQCVPLLKGIGYSISGMLLLQEITNSTLIGMCLLFLPDIFSSNLPWTNCNFPTATNTCIPMIQSTEKNLSKCILKSFAMQDYYKYYKLQLYPPSYTAELGPVNTNLAITIMFIWISVYIFMIIGFKRFQKIFMYLIQFTFFALLLVFVSTLFLTRKYHPKCNFYGNIFWITNLKFWILIFMNVCAKSEPGPAIYLISITDTSLKPNVIALLVCGLTTGVIIIMMIWFPLLVQNVLNYYDIDDPYCLRINGFDIIFAVIPDVLSRMPVPRLWLILWYLIIIDLGYISIVFTCTATLEALIDAHPFLKIYRVHLCFTLCAICYGINMLIVTPLSMVIIRTWTECGIAVLRTVILTLVTFSLFFIYSLVRISTDYHFAYDQPVSNFWIRCWKILPFLVLFQTVFIFYDQNNRKELKYSNPTIIFSTYCVTVLVLLPIFIVLLFIYSKHIKHQTVSTIVKTESEWGYYNVDKRAARYRFNPSIEVRYKTKKLKCKHECLVHSKKLKKLQHLTNIRKFLLLAKEE